MKNSFLVIILFILTILVISGCNKPEYESIEEKKINIEKDIPHDEMPIIESYSFGSIIINGKSYGDIKIHNNNIYSWEYIKHHTVTKDDIKDIIEGVDFIVIGIGSYGRVEVEDEVLTLLNEKGIKTIIEETKKAVDEYNGLVREGKKVAAILHSTC